MLLCKALTYACSSNEHVRSVFEHTERRLSNNARYTQDTSNDTLKMKFGLPIHVGDNNDSGIGALCCPVQESIGYRIPIVGLVENGKEVIVIANGDKLQFYKFSEKLGLCLYMIVKLRNDARRDRRISQIEVLHLNKTMPALIVCLCDNRVIYIVNVKTGKMMSSIDLKITFEKFVCSGSDVLLYGDCCYITLVRISSNATRMHRSKIQHLNFWAQGFIKLDPNRLVVVSEKGDFSLCKLDCNGEFENTADTDCNEVKIGIKSYGKIHFIKELMPGYLLICQELGWSVYKVAGSFPDLDEIVSSPTPSTFENISTGSSTFQFAILMSNCQIMYVNNGSVVIIDKGTAVGVFGIGDRLFGLFTSRNLMDNATDIAIKYLQSDVLISGAKFTILDKDCSSLFSFYDDVVLEGAILLVDGNHELCVRSTDGVALSILGIFTRPLLLAINATSVLQKLQKQNYLCLLLVDVDGELTIFKLHNRSYSLKGRLSCGYMKPVTKVEALLNQNIIIVKDTNGKQLGVDLDLMTIMQKDFLDSSSNNLITLYNASDVFNNHLDRPLVLNNWLLKIPWMLFDVTDIEKGSRLIESVKKVFFEGGWISIIFGMPTQTVVYRVRPNFEDVFSAEFEILRSTFDTLGNRNLRRTNELEIIKAQKDLCFFIHYYHYDISNKAFDALANLVYQVACTLPQLSNKVFNFWRRKLKDVNNVADDFFFQSIIILSQYVACGLMTPNKEYLDDVFELLFSSSSRNCYIALKILDLIFIPQMDQYEEQCLELVGALINIRNLAENDNKVELTEICNMCINDFFTEDAVLFSAIVCYCLASLETSFISKQGALEVLNYLLTDRTSKINGAIIMLVLDVLNGIEINSSLLLLNENQRKSILDLTDLTWNILTVGFPNQLQIVKDKDMIFVCFIFEKDISIGYAGFLCEKGNKCASWNKILLQTPIYKKLHKEPPDQKKIGTSSHDLGGYAKLKLSDNLLKIAALDFDTLCIDIWSFKSTDVKPLGEVLNSKIMTNENVPLKVPDLKLVLLQLLWSKGNYSVRFSKVPVTKLVQLYQSNSLEKEDNLVEKSVVCEKHISFVSVLNRYMGVFEDIKFTDLDIEWFGSYKDPKIGLKLKNKIIYMYQI